MMKLAAIAYDDRMEQLRMRIRRWPPYRHLVGRLLLCWRSVSSRLGGYPPRFGLTLTISLCWLLGVAVAASAWQWPFADSAIQRGFLQPDWGRPLHGLALEAPPSSPLHPIAPGELLFELTPSASRSHMPHVLGNFVALNHDNHLRSLYAHIEVDRQLTEQVEKAAFARAAATGFVDYTGAEVRIMDRLLGGYINPIVLFPAIPNSPTPRIGTAELRYPNSGRRFILAEKETSAVETGIAEIWIEATAWPGGGYPVLMSGVHVRFDNQILEFSSHVLREEMMDDNTSLASILDNASGLGGADTGRDGHSFAVEAVAIDEGSHQLELILFDTAGAFDRQRYSLIGVPRP